MIQNIFNSSLLQCVERNRDHALPPPAQDGLARRRTPPPSDKMLPPPPSAGSRLCPARHLLPAQAAATVARHRKPPPPGAGRHPHLDLCESTSSPKQTPLTSTASPASGPRLHCAARAPLTKQTQAPSPPYTSLP
uniref:Uncharacterized protein n=1 Tax=Oryza brachyantha TaxID=4533 RepID=J3L3I8_ORYBR